MVDGNRCVCKCPSSVLLSTTLANISIFTRWNLHFQAVMHSVREAVCIVLLAECEFTVHPLRRFDRVLTEPNLWSAATLIHTGQKRHVWLKRTNLQWNKVQTRVTYALTPNCMQSENRVWAMCRRWPACYWHVCACAQVCPLRVHPCPLPMTMSVCRCTLVSTHTLPLLLGIL